MGDNYFAWIVARNNILTSDKYHSFYNRMRLQDKQYLRRHAVDLLTVLELLGIYHD